MVAEIKQPPAAVATLADLLQLECVEPTLYRVNPPAGRPGRLYGGEVAAQAVMAAAQTVPPDRAPNAITAHYLSAGDPSGRTLFTVGQSRDGRSFSVRHVEARQGGRIIFAAIVSFHVAEDGMSHQLPRPPGASEVGPSMLDPANTSPVALRHNYEVSGVEAERAAWLDGIMERLRVEICFPDVEAAQARRSGTGERFFFRVPDALPDDPLLHAAGLTYLSDLLMVSATLTPHGIAGHAPNLQFATLNHSLWLHAPVRADEWLLCDIEGTWTRGARGLARGQIFNHEGHLSASTVQEALLRPHRASACS